MANGHLVGQDWPAWRYGPEGRSAVFNRPEDVPEGWTDGSAAKATPAPAAAPEPPKAVPAAPLKQNTKFTRKPVVPPLARFDPVASE